MRIVLVLFILLLCLQFSFAEDVDVDDNITVMKSENSIRLISPVGTMVRSAVFPDGGSFIVVTIIEQV